jgi:hypothetical protein
MHWLVVECFAAAKGEVGLASYEVRRDATTRVVYGQRYDPMDGGDRSRREHAIESNAGGVPFAAEKVRTAYPTKLCTSVCRFPSDGFGETASYAK